MPDILLPPTRFGTLRSITAAMLFSVVSASYADDVLVAAAANFTATLETLAPVFKNTTGHTLIASYGSTGKLYAQIEHGAPYQVFLAADRARPQRAEQQGLAVPGSRFTYATGKLVLWSANSDAFDQGDQYLQNAAFTHLAIANPKTAPYGMAAQQALEYLQRWQQLQSKLVRGDSIAQTFQFVASGNADAGLIAQAQLVSWQGPPGSLWPVPQGWYQPIEQQAVLLTRASDNIAANVFMDFLKSAHARQIIAAHGYDVDQGQ